MIWLLLLVPIAIFTGGTLARVRYENGQRHARALRHIAEMEAELGVGVVTVQRLGPPSNYTQVFQRPPGYWWKKELQSDGSWATTRLPDGPTQLERAQAAHLRKLLVAQNLFYGGARKREWLE